MKKNKIISYSIITGLLITTNLIVITESTEVEARKRSNKRSNVRYNSSSSKDRVAPNIILEYDSVKKVKSLKVEIIAEERGLKKSGIKKIELVTDKESKKIYKKKLFSKAKNKIETNITITKNGSYEIIATDKKGNVKREYLYIDNIK